MECISVYSECTETVNCTIFSLLPTRLKAISNTKYSHKWALGILRFTPPSPLHISHILPLPQCFRSFLFSFRCFHWSTARIHSHPIGDDGDVLLLLIIYILSIRMHYLSLFPIPFWKIGLGKTYYELLTFLHIAQLCYENQSTWLNVKWMKRYKSAVI